MIKTVLWQNEEGLKTTKNIILCLTFLTTHPDSIPHLIYLPAEAFDLISGIFPSAIFYSLCYIEGLEGVPFYDMRMSLVPLRKLKELCMVLELNADGERVADIDVHILFRQSGKLVKISRKIF
jgi:hypothetical protein